MQVAIIGANGQLGSDLMKVFGKEAHALTRENCDVTDFNQVFKVLKNLRPGLVINCAAYQKVDACEIDFEPAFLVNAIGALHVALATRAIEAILVYISSDYVFSHSGPWDEWDTPEPLNLYGLSKLWGEYATMYSPRYVIVRTSSLFGVNGSRGKGGNFVETMIKLGRERKELTVTNDLLMSPTYTKHLAEGIFRLFSQPEVPFGIYHITNKGIATWKGFAEEIFRQLGWNIIVKGCRSRERDVAERPRNSVLLNTRLDFSLPHWERALNEYLKAKGYL